jgi:hypothetical protein
MTGPGQNSPATDLAVTISPPGNPDPVWRKENPGKDRS